VSPFRDEHWQVIAGRKDTKAHVLKPGWPRTLCGLRTLNVSWESAPACPRCGACLRRIENSQHWLHVLGILR